MAKYIIDVPDEAVSFMDDEMSFFVEPKIKDERRRHYVLRIDEEDVSIYTEPDREAVENEVWELVKVIEEMEFDDYEKCFSNYGHEAFFDHPYQEAKSKYEAWKKQKEDEATMKEVTALAEKIGVHRLYAIVKEIRGE